MAFVIKAAVAEPPQSSLFFSAQKTMYGGKSVAVDDTIFVFASENEGGKGLIARGRVVAVSSVASIPGARRQTPRVDLRIEITALNAKRLGRAELRSFTDWDDGRPQTELNFKLYRQATNKVVGISDATTAFLDGMFI